MSRGLFVYAMLNGLVGVVVWCSGGRIEPREYDLKEYWTWRGGGRAPWLVRAIKSHCRRPRAAEDAGSISGLSLEETQVGSMQAAERRTDLPSKEYPEHVAEPATPGQAASATTYRLGR